jgi:hypothetical protein
MYVLKCIDNINLFCRYVQCPAGEKISNQWLQAGNYQVSVVKRSNSFRLHIDVDICTCKIRQLKMKTNKKVFLKPFKVKRKK